jgi:hypothetical protein
MSFSASTCLSNLGLLPLGPIINVYSDYDSYNTIITTVSTSDITGENCPYTFIAPDGTTNVKLYDPTSECFSIISVNDCGFAGYVYDVSTVSPTTTTTTTIPPTP